jgi:general secretion pathway protein K
MALALVLWSVVLMTILVGSVQQVVRTELALARNRLDLARAEAAADGGIALALLALAGRSAAARVFPPLLVDVGGLPVTVIIEDENGKVDLNAAPASLLADLFAAAGSPPDAARRLSEAVVARRGREPGPAFITTDELELVEGMTPGLLAALGGAVTVRTGADAVDPLPAPPLVVLALAGDEAAAASYLERRAAGDFGAVLASAHARSISGGGLMVRAEATAGGVTAVRVAVVRPNPLFSPTGFDVVERASVPGP